MIVHETQEDHFIHFIDVLVYNESVKFVNKEIQLVLTLDLVMLLGEYFLGYLGLPHLMYCGENQNEADYDNH